MATAPGGVSVWTTLGRYATDSAGNQCIERTLEIRRGELRIPVPLLYTREAPEVVDDTTLRARLWHRCRPGDTYRIDLRSGQPVRERRQTPRTGGTAR